MRHRRLFVIISLLLSALACIVVAAGVLRYTSIATAAAKPGHASSPAKATPEKTVIRADGRVIAGPNGQVTVGAEMPGTIEKVLVSEGQIVKAGDVLVTFRSTERKSAVWEAHALAREAGTTVRFLDRETRKTKKLVDSGALPKDALDKLVYERSAARAKLGASWASAQRLGAAAKQTRIVAPIDGTVVTRKVEPGETVLLGAPLLVVADLSKLRVSAEVDEFDAQRVALGMKASVTIDGLAVAPAAGTVEQIGDAIVPRRIRPQDPTRPTEPQVLEVKIMLQGPTPLKLGQRVNVTLEAGGDS